MLAHLHLQNVGPIPELIADVDPRGHVTFSGPSMAGKSSATRALVGALWLGDAPVVHAGADRASVSALTGGGTKLDVTVTPTGSWTRAVQRKGDEKPTRISSHVEFATWTAAAQHPDLVRLIAYPRRWEALYQPELGRPLRDLLMTVLPRVDLRERITQIMAANGHAVTDQDFAVARRVGQKWVAIDPADPDYPMELVDALRKRQTEANKVRDTATGAERTARKRLDDAKNVKVDAPTQDDVRAAEATLAAAQAWKDHDVALAAWKEADAATAKRTKEREGWLARKAALGERPVVDADARQAARVKAQNAQARVDRLRQEEAAAVAAEKARAEEAAKAAKAAEMAAASAERQRADMEARHAAEMARAQEATVTPSPIPVGRTGGLFGGTPPAAGVEVCPTCGQPMPVGKKARSPR